MSPLAQNIFRAYDIRGKYPSEVNSKTFFEIGIALGKFFNLKTKKLKNLKTIIIGRDVRLTSLQLKKSFVEGLKKGSKEELNIVDIGLSTTPMLNFCVNKFKALGGAIITASHDPKEYNGLKVLGPNATILSGKDVLKIIKK
ncbi:MAG: hypothetical protein NUV83_00800 [Candidatus Wolfebacteria bacterium]|nr:hypothetical protein [Candidatus Wolfebacteria bacterium]